MKTRLAFAACLLALTLPGVGRGEGWDLAGDFSGVQNPNGAWSYGWRAAANDPLILYTEQTNRCASPDVVEIWDHYIEDYCPSVIHNPQDYSVICDSDIWAPHKALFHPGPAQQSVVRWTAPAPMELPVAARFQTLSYGSSIIHIYHNGSEVFSATMDFFGETADYDATIVFAAGDRLDIAIDPISFYGDGVQLDVFLGDLPPGLGACCFPSGDCLMGTQAGCDRAGGSYLGDDVPCDPNPCEATPVERATWGEVRSLFR